MTGRRSSRVAALIGALLAGLVIRLAAVTLPGADDLSISKTWSYAASSDTTSMYGVEGAATARPVARWRSRSAPVDAPPGVLYLLGLIGRGYRASSPAFDDSAYLTAAIKLVTLLLDAATCAFVWALARRFAGDAFAGVAAIGYWLNPATLMNGAVLGYLDPWMTAPALAALLAADAGMAFVAGAALAAALLVQVQTAIVAPLVALLLWHAAKKRWQSAALTAAGFALVACAALAPFVVRGALPGIARAVVSPIRGELTSVSAANLWWVVSWLMHAAHNPKDLAHWGAWRITVRAEPISRVASLGVPEPQWMALAIVGLCGLWALYRAQAAIARGATPAVIVAAGAFTVHAYFALAMGLHANQLFLAIPLLAVSAAALPQLRRMVAAISGIAALNLFLFDGVGRGFPLPPRHLTIVDATLLLAAVNVVVLVRHAAALSATCESSGRYDRASPGGWG